jgi:RHS repeat-associated protein
MLTAGATTFSYDNNGNRLTETGSSGTTTYSYDANNRLLSAAAPAGTSSFTYDGDGNRVTQVTLQGTYQYANDTASALPVVLTEKGPDGLIDYAYGLGLMESSSSTFNYFYNLDGLGSVSNLTDAKGTVQETYSYDAWGNALTASGNVGTQNKFRFTGQALDPVTGLYFLRARYYDQTSGRLLNKDPLAGLSRFPVTLNRYPYAANNPVKLVDPSGKQVAQVIPLLLIGLLRECQFSEECWQLVQGGIENITGWETGQTPTGWIDYMFLGLGDLKGLGGIAADIDELPPPQSESQCVQSPALPPDLFYNPQYLLPPPVPEGPSIGPAVPEL